MPTLITIEEFEDELDALVQANPDDGGLIDALIEELGADSAMLETLCDEVPKWHYMFNPSFDFLFMGGWSRTRTSMSHPGGMICCHY